MSNPTELSQRDIEITARDLPLHCPMPSMKLWNSHPRVFIDVTTEGRAKCPYCGTNYTLSGPLKPGH
jgi:uncharacterized Zn-finger protein